MNPAARYLPPCPHNLPPRPIDVFGSDPWIDDLCDHLCSAERGIVLVEGQEGSGRSALSLMALHRITEEQRSLGELEEPTAVLWITNTHSLPDALGSPAAGTLNTPGMAGMASLTASRAGRSIAGQNTRPAQVTLRRRDPIHTALSAIRDVQITTHRQEVLALDNMEGGAIFVFDCMLDDSAQASRCLDVVSEVARKHRVLIITGDAKALAQNIRAMSPTLAVSSMPPLVLSSARLQAILDRFAQEERNTLSARLIESVKQLAHALHAQGRLTFVLLQALCGWACSGVSENGTGLGLPDPRVLASASAQDIARDIRQRQITKLGQLDRKLPYLLLLSLSLFDLHLGPTAAMLEQILADELVRDAQPLRRTPRAALLDALAVLRRQRLIVRRKLLTRQGLEPGERYSLSPMGYELVMKEALLASATTRALHEKVLRWYLAFTEKNGGLDWEDWPVRFSHLRTEWPNLLRVMDWCLAQRHFADICALWDWRRLQHFSNIFGFWPERQWWLTWIIKEGDARPPKSDALNNAIAEAKVALAYTHVHFGTQGDLNKAETLLRQVEAERAQAQGQHAMSSYAVCEAMVSFTMLWVRRGNYARAEQYLAQLEQDVTAHLPQEPDEMWSRWNIELSYYHGLIAYHRGNLDEAAQHFQHMHRLGRDHKPRYSRASLYAMNCLADTTLKQHEQARTPQEAKVLLKSAKNYLDMITGQWNNACFHDTRRYTYKLRTNAYYWRAAGDDSQAKRCARDAQWRFALLRMKPESDEMAHF